MLKNTTGPQAASQEGIIPLCPAEDNTDTSHQNPKPIAIAEIMFKSFEDLFNAIASGMPSNKQ